MDKNNTDMHMRKKRFFLHRKGVTWFSRETERRIFFVLTLLMLVWGIVSRVGF